MQNGTQNPTALGLQNVRNNANTVWNANNDLALQQQLANNFNRINPGAVGTEAIEDIIGDLKQALDGV